MNTDIFETYESEVRSYCRSFPCIRLIKRGCCRIIKRWSRSYKLKIKRLYFRIQSFFTPFFIYFTERKVIFLKVVSYKPRNAHALASIFVLTLLVAATAVLCYSFLTKHGANTASSQADIYKTRSGLLTEAMDSVGVCEPERAADVWAKGLMERSAALQYCVMTKQLKSEYSKQLESTFPNWVTGVSSPYVSGYKITKTQNPDKNTCIYTLLISTKTSAGPAGDYIAVLTVVKEGEFRRISNIEADDKLYAYTGFISPTPVHTTAPAR